MTPEAPESREEPEALAARRVLRAYRLGAAIGLVLFLVVLTGARPTLLPWTPAGDFYDAQASSILDGRLDIDADRLGIEGFEHDGRTYMYQPPWPALLRIPVVAATDRYEGRLGAPSMLLAQIVLVAAAGRILLEGRRSLRPDAGVGRLERLGAAAFGLVVAGGSVPTFLASRAWVYHEAAIWGAAWALVAVAGILSLRRRPSASTTLVIALGCAGAVLSRASVGAGTCVAVGVLALVVFAERRGRPLTERLGGAVGPIALLLAAALPTLAYGSLNIAKFGTVASIPFEDQAFTRLSPARQVMLEQNDGTLFGVRFAPTTLLHYLRPTGIRVDGAFPFVDFPPAGGPVLGDVTFDLVDHTGSIPATLPALLAPAVVGAWILGRRSPGRRSPGRRSLGRRSRGRPPLGRRRAWAAVAAGGVAGSLTIVPFGYVAHRYLADVLPLLVPLAALGLQGVFLIPGRWRRWITAAVAAGLVVWTVWTNVGLATVYQRLRAPNPPPALVAGLVDARQRVGAEPQVVTASRLPGHAARDDLAAIDDCAALYVWDGSPIGEFRRDAWVPVERTRRAGHVRLRLDLDLLRPGARHVLASSGRGAVVVWVERRPGGVVGGVRTPEAEDVSRPAPEGDGPWFDVVIDHFLGEAVLGIGDRELASAPIDRGPARDLVVGAAPSVVGYERSTPILAEASDDGSLCREAVGASDGRARRVSGSRTNTNW